MTVPLITVCELDFLHLDLSPARRVIDPLLLAEPELDPQIQFQIDFPRAPSDPRELSEIPEVRLWFVRLDTVYPWLPLWLAWPSELTRYSAMLVPHQFSPQEGIQYNPEALELFLMGKLFVGYDWLVNRGLPGVSRLKAMAQTLGYELEDDFFNLLTS